VCQTVPGWLRFLLKLADPFLVLLEVSTLLQALDITTTIVYHRIQFQRTHTSTVI
jgi:hypothetical protein